MELKGKEIDLSSLSALKEFASFFDKDYIEALARETGFISRSTSRLSGAAFLKMMVENIVPRTEWSLNDQCDYLREHFGIDITKQSLDGRYHTFAVAFLKSAYQAVLQKSFHSEMASVIKTSFDSIYLTDSTSFQLPAHLAAFYISNGGSTSGSSVKIHQTLELLRFKICDFLITDGKASDQNYWHNKGFELAPNSLWISDLGYFSWDTLAEVAAAGSYFLCRYKTGTALYTRDKAGKYNSLDIEQYVKTIDAKDGARSLEVYFGKQKIKGRLISEQVPDGVKQQRLKKYRAAYANQSKKEVAWKMTPLKELLCGFNLYITNAGPQQLGDENISLIYGLRWQIELIFKIWKSLLFLDKVGQMSIFRFESFLYGRLIFILLSTELMSMIRAVIGDVDVEAEISEWKTMKLIKKNYGP
jgi:hypothetical protein